MTELMSTTEDNAIAGRNCVFIVGSCVTRDAFDIPGHGFEIFDYVARSSFACSMRASPFVVPDGDIDPEGAVESNWQRRMVEIDLGRGLRRRLRETRDPAATLLVVDFIDERFHLLCLADEVATSSVELQRMRLAERLPTSSIIHSGTDEHFELWRQGFGIFVAEARALGMEPIVNRVRWASATSDGSPLREPSDYIAASNRYLGRLYEAADALHLRSITYGAAPFVAAAAHKWGPAPFHYVDDVYLKFLNELNRLSAGPVLAHSAHSLA